MVDLHDAIGRGGATRQHQGGSEHKIPRLDRAEGFLQGIVTLLDGGEFGGIGALAFVDASAQGSVLGVILLLAGERGDGLARLAAVDTETDQAAGDPGEEAGAGAGGDEPDVAAEEAGSPGPGGAEQAGGDGDHGRVLRR